jgi:hypothetical protein
MRMGILAMFVLGALTSLLAAEVTVRVAPPKVVHHVFDPFNPPADMPPLHPGEAAVAVSNFKVVPSVRGTILSGDGDRFHHEDGVRLRVDSIEIEWELEVEIWLPEGASTKLRNHEEGHRIIAERHYESAEEISRRLAAPRIGSVVTGRGQNVRAAGRHAAQLVSEELSRELIRQMTGPAEASQALYDRITDHGRNAVPEARAIEQALLGKSE